MAMTNRNNTKFDSIIMHTLDELVPQDHLVRKLENALDFRFIYPKVRHCYSRHGRPSIDPVVLFKMLMINILFGYNSMRRTCQEIQVNLAHRWFLGLAIDESVPNFSTWSQNYIRRYKDSAIFEEIFEEILSLYLVTAPTRRPMPIKENRSKKKLKCSRRNMKTIS